MVWTGINLWHWFLDSRGTENCTLFSRALSQTCLTLPRSLVPRVSVRVGELAEVCKGWAVGDTLLLHWRMCAHYTPAGIESPGMGFGV